MYVQMFTHNLLQVPAVHVSNIFTALQVCVCVCEKEREKERGCVCVVVCNSNKRRNKKS